MPSSLLLLLPPAALAKQANFKQGISVVVVILATITICLPVTSALRCYTCSYTAADHDDSCLRDARGGEVRITDCTKKFCTITRQEATGSSGKVISFIRDCLDKPLFLNKVIEDETFKTYYRSCNADLCNDSDGKGSASSTAYPNNGAAPNDVIAGRGGAATGASTSVILIALSVAVLLLIC